jgi:S-adenosylmethionine:tRNA ribosyltransferase-isomerase
LWTKSFDYYLPAGLIAQEPAPDRAQARLMLVHRATGEIGHHRVSDLPSLLQKDDLMVLNDTRVIPARMFGHKRKTGGRVEVLFIEEKEKNVWQVFLHSSGRPKVGDIILLAKDKLEARVNSIGERGRAVLELHCADDFSKIMEAEGLPPLPPYIKRPKEKSSVNLGIRISKVVGRGVPAEPSDVRAAHPEGSPYQSESQRQLDSERYQTVYARVPGAIAAPTAGLHLSRELLAALEKAGIKRTSVTLHVGPGTFIPVRCEKIEDHKMESERFVIELPSARKINQALAEKRRIVAVGTTTVRTLESAPAAGGKIAAGNGRTEIFIYPPFRFQAVGALLTNFHLPRSTLLMLVSAFADRPAGSLAAAGSSPRRTGRELIRHAYETAVKEKYRFYSYGDCMLIL